MAVDRILGRLDSLIDMGGKVLATRRPPPHNVAAGDFVESALSQQWRTSSLAFLKSVFGLDGIHYRDFEERCKSLDKGWSQYNDAERGLAILRAAKEDIDGGYLQRVEMLVSGEVFSDFLDMAEHLLDNDYKDPVASLIGAVLEDGLRRMCANNTLPVQSGDNISSLNQKLADKKVYNRLQQREIETWNKLRDYADHGRFEEYSSEKVGDMLEGTRKFLDNYLK